jgi:hypothetical protein
VAAADFRFSRLIDEVVRSIPFRMRRGEFGNRQVGQKLDIE